MRAVSARTVGLVRRQLEGCTRSDIHQLLIEAGSDPALEMPFRDRMTDPLYRSKAQMLSDGFDAVARDREAGDAFVLDAIRALARRNPESVTSPESGIGEGLARDGIALTDVLGHERPVGSAELQAYLERENLKQAMELHRKSWARVETDPSGAITAATSCAETVLIAALDELSIDRTGVNQLPDLLTLLRRDSNLDELLPHGEPGRRFMRSLSSLAHNAYGVAHEAGDRHGGDAAAVPTDPETAYVFVSSTEQISGVVVRGLRRRALRRRR